jgi:hypothetical protein
MHACSSTYSGGSLEPTSSRPTWARHQWLTPIILDIQEAEIRRITVRSWPGQIVCKTLSQKKKKKTRHKNRAGEVAEGEGSEFKSHYRKKKD